MDKPKLALKLKAQVSNLSSLPPESIPNTPQITIKSTLEPPVSNNVTFYPQVLTADESHNLYDYLKHKMPWKDGIRSRCGPTRQAIPVSLDDDDLIKWAVMEVFKRINLGNFVIFGLYLNYYRDGNDYTPEHRHKDTTQLVISLCEPDGDRQLTVNSSTYMMGNGDIIIFDDQKHGIPKMSNRKGRISLATFMKYAPELHGSVAYVG